MTLRERYLTNAQGERTDVLLPVADYRRLQTRLAAMAALPHQPITLTPDTEAQLRAVFATLTEDEIDQAEAGEGPYVWLIDILDEIGCARLMDEAKAAGVTEGDMVDWETAEAEIERAWAK